MHDDSLSDPICELLLDGRRFPEQPMCWQNTVHKVKQQYPDQATLMEFPNCINKYLSDYNLTYVRYEDNHASKVIGKQSDLTAWMISHG
jgi:hypothetical protein